jgi:hypothetical protein
VCARDSIIHSVRGDETGEIWEQSSSYSGVNQVENARLGKVVQWPSCFRERKQHTAHAGQTKIAFRPSPRPACTADPRSPDPSTSPRARTGEVPSSAGRCCPRRCSISAPLQKPCPHFPTGSWSAPRPATGAAQRESTFTACASHDSFSVKESDKCPRPTATSLGVSPAGFTALARTSLDQRRHIR